MGFLNDKLGGGLLRSRLNAFARLLRERALFLDEHGLSTEIDPVTREAIVSVYRDVAHLIEIEAAK